MLPTRTPIQHIEAFHLTFLRALETAVRRDCYVVKGGVNLRAWFNSARYSEDLDLDVIGLDRASLAERVDRLLASRAFELLRRQQGFTISRISKPKQTDTTQRWKFELVVEDGSPPLPTKVEFSRRGSSDPFVLEPVRTEIVRPYGMPAPTANHYTAAGAIRQKLRALAGRPEPQARDVWDLEHLFRTTGADPRPLGAELSRSLELASERVLELPFDAFRSQVVSYLDADAQEIYSAPLTWERLRERVLDELQRLAV